MRFAIVLIVLVSLLILPQQVMADNSGNSVNGQKTSVIIDGKERHLGLIIPEDVKKRLEELDRQPPPALLSTEDVFDWREMGFCGHRRIRIGYSNCGQHRMGFIRTAGSVL